MLRIVLARICDAQTLLLLPLIIAAVMMARGHGA
jgi:hypothetical protein